MVQLELIQLMHVKQLLEQNANQARHVSETFGYRELGGFPTGLNPMQVTGNSSGEYSVDVFAKSKKWLGTPPSRVVRNGETENKRFLDGKRMPMR